MSMEDGHGFKLKPSVFKNLGNPFSRGLRSTPVGAGNKGVAATNYAKPAWRGYGARNPQ